MTPALFYGSPDVPGLRDIVSVWTTDSKINLKKAPAAVLQVLSGKDAAGVAELVAQRDATEDDAGDDIWAQTFPLAPELEQFRADHFSTEEKTRRVFLEARADLRADRNQSHIATVVDINSEAGAEAITTMHWFDRAPWTGHLPTGRDVQQSGAK